MSIIKPFGSCAFIIFSQNGGVPIKEKSKARPGHWASKTAPPPSNAKYYSRTPQKNHGRDPA